MVVIGIDPHKGSRTAVAIDEDETKLDEVCLRPRRWRVARGLEDLGVGVPEAVLGHRVGQRARGASVPAAWWERRRGLRRPTEALSARVRVLGDGRVLKNDPQQHVVGRVVRRLLLPGHPFKPTPSSWS